MTGASKIFDCASPVASAPVVAVVLSTYNGVRYLPEFLASLAAQHRRPDRIVLRDDGSSDASPALVERWAEGEGIALQRVTGAPMGPAGSFLAALAASHPADVTLLADQDDVWLPEKIARAVERLQGRETIPALYASRLRIVDATLRPMRDSERPSNLSFASAACESVLTGCTMALNRPLVDLVRKGPGVHVQMHDWWLYMLASATGAVEFDDRPLILYRQHDANVLGSGSKGWRALAERARRFRTGASVSRGDQLAQLLDGYASHLSPDARRLVQLLVQARASLPLRIRAALTAGIRRQTAHEVLTTRLAILLNRF